MSNEETKNAPSVEDDKQSSVYYWANGLNLIGYGFLALTFVFAFAPKITTALPLFASLVFACIMFVASAFVKIFKSDEWDAYCWRKKKEATLFSILNFFAASCFIILFLLTGGFGLFHMVFSDAIPTMSKHLIIGSVAFLAVGLITLLISGISGICSVKGFFAKSVDENDTTIRGNEEWRRIRWTAPEITYAHCGDDIAMAECVNKSKESAIAEVNFTKRATDLSPNEFETLEDARKFFVSVIAYYCKEGKYPQNVSLNIEEKDYVQNIASLAERRKEAHIVLIDVSSAKSSSSHL